MSSLDLQLKFHVEYRGSRAGSFFFCVQCSVFLHKKQTALEIDKKSPPRSACLYVSVARLNKKRFIALLRRTALYYVVGSLSVQRIMYNVR